MLHIDYTQDEMGKMVDISLIDRDHYLFDQAMVQRELMIDQLSEYDEYLGDLYLSEPIDKISQDAIDEAIRRAIKSGRAVPLMCGSALKNKGIQPLLDAVLKYLPSPESVVAQAENATSGEKM